MKKFSLIVSVILVIALLAGCAGTPVVYYSDCTCPTGSHEAPVVEPTPEETVPVAEGALKTGLAVIATAADSESAVQADYSVDLAAVLVDENGIIRSCVIDSVGTTVTFDATGTITADLNAEILSKNELGENYGMKAYAGATYEWYEQAQALADYAVGKTVEELKTGAVNESGKAADADLASTATIYLGGYVTAIEEAVNNAQHLGAQSGDVLKLSAVSSIDGSKNADAENEGLAQLYVTVSALTMNGDTITSCFIDAVQANVNFDATGTITTDLSAPIQTKNQLGENYGMVAYGGAIAEWDEQAASFAAYITGKTPAEVAGIAVDEKTAPTDADLTASVTIKIGDFLKLIEKTAK